MGLRDMAFNSTHPHAKPIDLTVPTFSGRLARHKQMRILESIPACQFHR